MYLKDYFYLVFILCLCHNCFTQRQNSTNSNETATVTIASNTTTSTTCEEGYVNPDCKICATNYERKEDKCLLIQNQAKSTRSAARRIFLLFLGCILTAFLITTMVVLYRRSIEQNRRQSSPPSNTNMRDRFNNILQSIGLNNLTKRGRLNFFSISNNNHPSGGHQRQPETSRTHLSENQDEALLFDDPYTDGGVSGGIHGSSANPYKSLTLSVT